MKRFPLSLLAFLTTLSMTTSAFASIESTATSPIEQSAEYTYTCHGITFAGPNPLSETQLESMYESMMKEIRTSIIDGPGGSAKLSMVQNTIITTIVPTEKWLISLFLG